jgi:3-dehydroquinate synthase
MKITEIAAVKVLQVDLGERSYPVIVGGKLLARAGKILAGLGFSNAPILVSNTTVLRLHGDPLRRSLERSFGPVSIIRIGDGEHFKNQHTLLKIYDGLFRAKADRRSWLVAFGGGVVSDIAGFAAATYMRGIPYVGVPTTLLAQVDSSIGGKVGVNLPQGKNLIGAFHQPRAVLSDTAVLQTLPARELAAGLFEVVKAGAICSGRFLTYIERNLRDIQKGKLSAMEHVVLEAAKIKADVVSRDEREGEFRMILNFGHTIGHALEAATGYRRFKHGEAVAWGMIAALGFGRELGFRPEKAREFERLIHRIEPLPSLDNISCEAVWDTLQRDKKFRSGGIRMVLLPQLGQTEIRADIDAAHLRRFLGTFLAGAGKIG